MPKIYGSSEIWGDLLVTGSFSILGSASSIYTTSLVVSDTIISLGHSQSGSPLLDEGIMFNRGTGLTQAFIWDETNDTFALIGTNDDHTVLGSVNIDSYSNLRVGGLTTSDIKITNGASSGYVLTSDASGNATWTSAASSSANFANTDLTLTGNRIHNTNGNDLIISSDGTGNDFVIGFIGTQSLSVGHVNYYQEFTSSDLSIQELGGTRRLEINSTETIFGPSNANRDFRIVGLSDSSAFFLDSLNDKVGIGTDTPTEKLEVNGKIKTTNFQMTTSPTAGYVLTSDSSGNATWQATSGGGTTPSLSQVLAVGNSSGVNNIILPDPAYIGFTSSLYTIRLFTTTLTANWSIVMPNKGGTMALVSDIPVLGVTGSGTINYIPRWLSSSNISSTSSVYDDGTNVGIGTTSPLYKVQVIGTVSTTGFRMTNGASNGSYLISDSSGNATWASIPGGLTGSGTTNYIPRWTATSTLSSTSTIYDDGTNVGIGTTSPSSKLNVVVNSASTSNFGIKSQVSNGNFSNYGLEISSSGPSSGTNYGLFSTVFGSNGQNTGIWSSISGTYGTTNTGIFTLILASASTENIGHSVRVSGGTKTTGISVGFGSGLSISGDTGLLNYVEASYISKQTTINGIYNEIQGSSTTKFGIQNRVTGTNSNTNYGIYNEVYGASTTNYGIVSAISGTYGTNYGFYANISGGNSNAFGHYVDMQSTSTNNYGMVIDSRNATNNYGVVVNRGTSIFNENGDANTDFRIEGDTNSNLFFVDASTDSIGIATGTPTYRLQVSGTISSTGLYNNGGLRNKVTDPGSNAIYTITTNDYIVTAQPLGSYVTFSLPLTPPTGTEIIITKQQSGTVSILTLGSESMVRGNSGGLTAINWNPGIYGMSKFIFMGGFWHTDAT